MAINDKQNEEDLLHGEAELFEIRNTGNEMVYVPKIGDAINEETSDEDADISSSILAKTMGMRRRRQKKVDKLKFPPRSKEIINRTTFEAYNFGEIKGIEINEVDPNFIVKNRTARRIGIQSKTSNGTKLVIPPFGSKLVTQTEINQYSFQNWKSYGLIGVQQLLLKPLKEKENTVLVVLFSWLVYGFFLKGLLIKWIGLGNSLWAPWILYFGIAGILALGSRGIRKVAQSLNVVIFFVIGVLIPGSIVYFYGGLDEYFSRKTAPSDRLVHIMNVENYKDAISGKLQLKIGPKTQTNTDLNIEVLVIENFKETREENNIILFEQIVPDKKENRLILQVDGSYWGEEWSAHYFPLSTSELKVEDRIEYQKNDPFLKNRLYQRGFQLVFGILLVLLPGMLYFQFENRQVGTLRERFFREIMLLNPSILTIDDAKTIYGNFIDEVGGIVGEKQLQYSLLTSARPILIATILLSLGWLFTLSPTGIINVNEPIYKFITPTASSMGFAFLGAYLFAINLILRRYLRGDLNPKAYSHITVRMLMAIILAWILDIAVLNVGTEIKYPLIFLVGIFPEAGVAFLIELVKKATGFVFERGLEKENPITKLGGISIYDRARLLEEGIESVESLAHSNLIELMIRTRIPTSRLVDLVDQAILFIHVNDMNDLKTLKENGIRTATDLIQSANENPEVLNILGSKENKRPQKLATIKSALEDDEWLQYIKFWRSQSKFAKESIESPGDFLNELGKTAEEV